MDILDILYTITIGPLKLLFEVIFSCANLTLNNPGLSIICLSFALNIILLPLYARAEKIQKIENDIQLALQPGVDHIKKSFKGDEQYMILQTYYRQNNYKPIYALRSLTSLLLQIPFFLAASGFLSNLNLLNGTSFFFIKDLGKPDGLLFGLNLLPIAMTIINLFNCIVYTKGQPFKSKIQLYLMALVFLVLLYNSPAGLSFYYLLNNLFSLIKNTFLKIKNRNKLLGFVIVFISITAMFWIVLFAGLATKELLLFLCLLSVICIYGMSLISNKMIIKIDIAGIKLNSKSFYISTIFLCLLMGLFIPSRVINSSPEEFIDMFNYINPINYVVYSFVISFGTFIIWFNIYYSLMKDSIKKQMSVLSCSLCFVCLINYLFFGTNLGTISNVLVYENTIQFSNLEYLINSVSFLIIVCVVYFAYKNNEKFVKSILLFICCALIVLSSINVININKVSNEVYTRHQNSIDNDELCINLSKNGRNVIVLMLDRAVSSYFPYILEEKPELKEQYAGFTYYPNTVSFGCHTNFSTPSLFGGYEYTPNELNKRDTELLKDKHDEALLVMPRLFSENGFKVTVCDPPYAGYKEIPDLSIYSEYPEIQLYITNGMFGTNDYDKVLERNLFCFSLTKSVPLILFGTLYNDGKYWQVNTNESNLEFLRSFAVLQNMINITKVVDDNSNNALVLQNASTHNPILNYNVTNFGIDSGLNLENVRQKSHYCVNILSLSELGKWLDYLKENDVYNNTRIIICSDHSCDLNLYPELVIGDTPDYDLMFYNPLLLIKDYNCEEYIVNESFMTLADIPYLATKDVVDNPTNPFTNKPIVEKNKNEDFYIINSDKYNISKNNGTTFLPSKWFAVSKDCRDIENWRIVDNINELN